MCVCVGVCVRDYMYLQSHASVYVHTCMCARYTGNGAPVSSFIIIIDSCFNNSNNLMTCFSYVPSISKGREGSSVIEVILFVTIATASLKCRDNGNCRVA